MSSSDPSVRTVRPGPKLDGLPTWICVETGERVTPPAGWAVLPPGDALATRRVKQGGVHWVAQEWRGRKRFARGVLAPAERIERVLREVEAERASPQYARRLRASRERSARKQDEYVGEFEAAVRAFLAFPPRYAALAADLAARVTAHTTEVGAGTVGRTRRIAVEERAAAAVIAWMRHHTTEYDRMEVARVKGERREVRRRLARRSHALLDRLRRGEEVDPATCPLHRALARLAALERPAPRAAPREASRPAAPRAAEVAAGRPLWQAPLLRRTDAGGGVGTGR